MQLTQYDTGLGTIYERHSIYSLTGKLAKELGIRSSIEGPLDGITGINGINSLALARAGVKTTVVLPQEDLIHYAKLYYENERCQSMAEFICSKELSSDSAYDLAWNFNCLPQVDDIDAVLARMAACSRKYILVFVPNILNYGFWLHSLYHRVKKEPWEHGNRTAMDPGKISKSLYKLGFKTIRKLYVDVPWWPDIHTPIEEVATTFLPFLKPFIKESQRLQLYKYNQDNFPYFLEERRQALLRILSAHPNFENRTFLPLMLFFAHHRGILAEKI
jgi:hypothetical protein